MLVARLTAALQPRSAEEAAADKARAGESAAVEHVAELSREQTKKARRGTVRPRKPQATVLRAKPAKRARPKLRL